MTITYFNGEYLPLEEVKVPVLDRGFIFGDGVYEVIPVYAGRLFRLESHFERLERSLAEISLVNPYSRTQWQTVLETVIARNHGGDQAIYLQVTRGVAKRDHQFPTNTTPTVFITSNPLTFFPPFQGIKAVTTEDIRWQRCDIKSIALLGNILLRQYAVEKGTTEAILTRGTEVTEGAASNVFIILNGQIITPPKSQFILAGVTRDLVLELLQTAGIPYCEAAISIDQLRKADEIWLTSSTREILPVITLDDKPVGNGQVGSMWQRVYQLFQDYKQKFISEQLYKVDKHTMLEVTV